VRSLETVDLPSRQSYFGHGARGQGWGGDLPEAIPPVRPITGYQLAVIHLQDWSVAYLASLCDIR